MAHSAINPLLNLQAIHSIKCDDKIATIAAHYMSDPRMPELTKSSKDQSYYIILAPTLITPGDFFDCLPRCSPVNIAIHRSRWLFGE